MKRSLSNLACAMGVCLALLAANLWAQTPGGNKAQPGGKKGPAAKGQAGGGVGGQGGFGGGQGGGVGGQGGGFGGGAGGFGGGFGGGGDGGGMAHPLMMIFDANRDGAISTAELEEMV